MLWSIFWNVGLNNITTIDCQPSGPAGGMLVFVSGNLQLAGEQHALKFSQRGGRIEKHIEVLHHKLWLIDEGVAFGGKKTKRARSHGKKFHVSFEQERSRKALSIVSDKNKQYNLAICLMNRGQIMEAKSLLQTVPPSSTDRELEDPFVKSFDRAYEMLTELESKSSPNRNDHKEEIKTGVYRSFTHPTSINSKPVASASPIMFVRIGLIHLALIREDGTEI
ncbi:Nuclear transport factor 2a [Thalictrum thalictroides]|uniref:Nuclear transport factor 2a n=1 Tax=Thalictrum thalictroides TaxID=46969 RepID=A0A7J6WFR3_THATH|nr:Nuclear transport factor 2a [Thalictrum thalictroides]